MNRLMIDTNILVFYLREQDRLSRDVMALLTDYESRLYISMETLKELVTAYRRKNLFADRWRTASEMVSGIMSTMEITVCTVDLNVVSKMALLDINEAEDHYDPSDHVIIAHAMTLGMPLISSDRKFLYYRKQGLDLIYNE